MTDRILVACVGNIFLGDDGFGVEVARRLARRELPEAARVVDFGTRGLHLAHELMDGYALLVLVDAAPHGMPAGTVSVIEVPPAAADGEEAALAPAIDPHGLAPDGVLALLDRLSVRPPRVLVVACEPQDVGPGIELTAPVRQAVPYAVRAVEEIVRRATTQTGQG
jgi:hydrogenase maturation protease